MSLNKPWKPKYWLLTYPRPLGIEPTIYTKEPDISDGTEDPFAPSILYFDNIQAAVICILNFNPTDEYLKNLKIK